MALTDPIAETLSVLRRSLLPGLLRATDQNLRRGAADVRLFEVGAVFRPAGRRRASRRAFARRVRVERSASVPALERHVASRPTRGTRRGLDRGRARPRRRSKSSFERERADLAGLHPGQSVPVARRRPAVASGGAAPASRARATPRAFGECAARRGRSGDGRASSGEDRGVSRDLPPPGTWRDLSLVFDAGAIAGDVMTALARVDSPPPRRWRGSTATPDRRWLPASSR